MSRYRQNGYQRRRFEQQLDDIRTRLGDRVICERLLRCIVAHWEFHHPYCSLAEVRARCPEDYDLYSAALG
jgi:hypothetical protein